MNILYKKNSIKSINFIISTQLILFLLLVLSSRAMEGMTIEGISQNPELMRDIAKTIMEREQEKVRLTEKMCKHNDTMTKAWESGKTWGQLGGQLQGLLTRYTPKSQVTSILARDRQGEMIPNIIENPEATAKKIIENGTPVLKVTGLNNDQYAIEISYDMTPETVGYNFYKGCDLHLIDMSLQEKKEEKIEYKNTPAIVKFGENKYKFVAKKASGVEEVTVPNEINVEQLELIFQHNLHEGKVFMRWENPVMKHLIKKEGHIKSEEKVIKVTETKAYVSFKITSIIPKLLSGGIHAKWNKESDGEVTTLCVQGS